LNANGLQVFLKISPCMTKLRVLVPCFSYVYYANRLGQRRYTVRSLLLGACGGWGTNGGMLELKSDVSYVQLQSRAFATQASPPPHTKLLLCRLLRRGARQASRVQGSDVLGFFSSWLGAAAQDEEEEEEEYDDGMQLERQSFFL
jgi:hypothetical protein